jgi:hypothetical protein
MMTNRERTIKTLLCQEADRAPFIYWLGMMPLGPTWPRWHEETGDENLNPAERLGIEPYATIARLEYGPWPHFEHKVLEKDDRFIVYTNERGITTRQLHAHNCMPEWVGHPVKNPEDWKRYKEERLQPDLEARLANMDKFLEEASAKDALVQVGQYPWGVFGTPRDMLGNEFILYAFYDYPEMIRDMMQTSVDIWLALYEEVAKRIQIDHIHIWEDMSYKTGPLISVKMIEEFMMPQYDRIAEFAKKNNIPLISVDSDGNCELLVEAMVKHGVNVFFPFEVQAGNDIEQYREKYPNLGIMGGLDKRALARGKKEIHVELDRCGRMLAKGGYVPGFDHLIPQDVPWDNFEYAVKEIKKLIGV